MDEIVGFPLATAELQHVFRKGLHVRQQFFLPDIGGRTGRDMDDPDAVDPFGGFGKDVAVAPREHIDVASHCGEGFRNLSHIEVLSSAIHTAEKTDGRRVFTDQCDLPFHVWLILLEVVQDDAAAPVRFAHGERLRLTRHSNHR